LSKLNFAKYVSNRLASLVSWDKTGTLLAALNVQTALTELALRTFSTYFDSFLSVSDGDSVTTSVTYVDKINGNTQLLQGGTYIVLYSAELQTSAANRDASVRVQVGGTTIAETKERATATGLFIPFAGFAGISLSSGVKNVTMSYAVSSNSLTIRRARIFLFRIGP
jgi:hypothetical protein